jgi:hypothetical protein
MDALLSQVQMQRRIHSTVFLFSENPCIQNLVGCAIVKCRFLLLWFRQMLFRRLGPKHEMENNRAGVH